MTERLRVLFIDDQPDDISNRASAYQPLFDFAVVHPRALTSHSLDEQDLVLVDYDLEYWDERFTTAPSLAMQPRDGLALAAIVRSYFRETMHRSCGVALHSARLEDLSSLPSEILEHVLSRNHDLEWVFSKANPTIALFGELPVPERIAELAAAVRSLPSAWPSEGDIIEGQAQDLLGLAGDETFGDKAWSQVLVCHPPLQDLSTDSGGLAFVRWLSQRILPYPAFLLDGLHVAAKLRISPEEIPVILEEDSDLARGLRASRYRGVLGGFLGPRWWAAGVSDLEGTIQRLAAGDERTAALQVLAGRHIDECLLDLPVVCLDNDLRALPTLFEGAAGTTIATRIRPDDWPIYAQPAWVQTERLNDSDRFAALAVWERTQLVIPLPLE